MSVRGLESFVEVIDLLKNPAKYDAKIEELKQAYQNYKDAVESVTKLSEVNEYTLNIRDKSAKIDEEYKTHQEKVAKELAALSAEVKETKAKLKDREEKVKQKEILSEQIAQEQFKHAKELSAFAEKLEQKSVELTQRQAQLDEVEKELAERKAKLLAAFA
jgi:chromosome segregation ATPase